MENTALVPGAPVHYDWVGYAGNDTVYLSSGLKSNLLLSQSLPGTAGASLVTANTSYTDFDRNQVTNKVQVANDVEMGTGGNIALGGGNNFSFSEQYISAGPRLEIAVPIVVAVKSATFNESNRMLDYVNDASENIYPSWQNISAWGVNISSVITGIKQSDYGYVNQLNETGLFDEAVNSSTSIDQKLIGSDYWGIILRIADMTAGVLNAALPFLLGSDPVPILDFITIPLTVFTFTYDAYDLVQGVQGSAQNIVQIPVWRTNSYEPNPIYHNYTATNGTFWGSNWSELASEFKNSNYSDSNSSYEGPPIVPAEINYTNTFFCNEMLHYYIWKPYFNQSGYLNLTAQNYISQQNPGLFATLNNDSSAPLPGAKSTLSIHHVPANTLWGQVIVDNITTLKNQNILITQKSSSGQVTYFYEKINGNGSYRFMAHPGWNYTLQAVTPYGLTNGKSVTPYGEGGTELTLNTYQSRLGISVTEDGLPSGDQWSVTLGSNSNGYQTELSTSQTVLFNVSSVVDNDSYIFSYNYNAFAEGGFNFTSPAGVISATNLSPIVILKAVPATGSITFLESGLPAGDEWSIYFWVTGQTISTTSSGILFTNLPYLGYGYTVISPKGYTSTPQMSSVNLNSNSVTVNITFSKIPPTKYSITFEEKGLPSDTSWGVKFNGTLVSSTTPITFYAVNGTYPFSVPDTMSGKYTYVSSPSSGTILVNGSNQVLTISFNTNYNSCVNLTTPILMANGTYELAKYITAGDRIMTYNYSTGQLQPETVELAYHTPQKGQVAINHFLLIAPDQKVLTSRGYQEAMNLTIGERIYNIFTGHWTRINSLYSRQGTFTMVDFYVLVNHDYVAWFYVMEDKII